MRLSVQCERHSTVIRPGKFALKWSRPAKRRALELAMRVGMASGLRRRFVADHFDVVPVRTYDESRIVVRVVLRAQTRRTFVFPARLESGAIESFDLAAVLGLEGQVKMCRLLLRLEETQ